MISDVMGLMGTYAYMVGGVLEGFLDALYVSDGPLAVRDYALGYVAKISGVCTLVQIAGTLGFSQVDSSNTWQQQTIARGVMIAALKLAVYMGGRGDPEAPEVTSVYSSIVSAIFAAWGMVINGLKFATSSSKNPLVLSQAIMSLVPNLVNPIKLTGDAEALYPFIPAVADPVFNFIAGGSLATEAIKSLKGNSETEYHLYFPVFATP